MTGALRQLPEAVRATFRAANASVVPGGIALVLGGCLLIASGALLASLWCDYQHGGEVQAVARLGQQIAETGNECVVGLREMSRTAVVLARNEERRPTHRLATTARVVSDSVARERRWMTPDSTLK